MKTDTLARMAGGMPNVFDDLLRPWNDWFDGRELWNRAASLPPVNIVEQEDKYLVSLAAPGMKRDDFKIDLSGNMLAISSETEEEKEEIESIFQFPSEEEDEITFLFLFQKIIILSVGYAFSGPWHVAIWD